MSDAGDIYDGGWPEPEPPKQPLDSRGPFAVVFTKHFMEALYQRRSELGFPSTKFFGMIGDFYAAGLRYRGDNCMVIVGSSKVVFEVSRQRDELVFITAMPEKFKNNQFMKAKTHFLGEFVRGGWSEALRDE